MKCPECGYEFEPDHAVIVTVEGKTAFACPNCQAIPLKRAKP